MADEPAGKTRYKVIPIAVIVTLMGILGLREGYRHTPYQDVGGVWTACNGLTGPDIIPSHYYTDAECKTLQTDFALKMTHRMGNCLTVSLSDKEWLAWSHWGWNIGAYGFCHSKAVRLLNQGKRREACEAMLDFYRAGGRDCHIRSNKCYGVITRRQYERALCLTGI